MKTTTAIAGFLLLATPLAFAPAHAEDEHFGIFGMASDMDPEQSGAGGGLLVKWNWVDDVYLTGQALFATYDDFDRAQVLLGGEWQDTIGRATGYVGLQGGVDAFDTDAGSEEDAFLRAYYDIGWKVFDASEVRIGIGHDASNDVSERSNALRLGWFTNLSESMTFHVRAELFEEEKNVFAGVSWPF